MGYSKEKNLNKEADSMEESTSGSGNARLFWIIGGIVIVIGAVVIFMMYKPSKSAMDTANTTTVTTTTNKATSTSSASVKISVAEEGKIILTDGYADPTIAKTTNGYRMYVNRQSGGTPGYMSFTSTDGTTWTKEKEGLITGAATGRAVVLPNGVRFYYPGMQPIKPSDPPADMYSAFASDGLSFKKDSGKALSPSDTAHYVEGPTVFQLPDKTWRMYFNENTTAAGNQRDGIIWGASSPDGITWTRDATPTLEADATESANQPFKHVLHPFVVANPKGGYIMFYNSHSEIYAATSTDGMKWDRIGKVGIHGADIDGYFQDDGTFRAFYGDFSESTQGVVYMAVLKVG